MLVNEYGIPFALLTLSTPEGAIQGGGGAPGGQAGGQPSESGTPPAATPPAPAPAADPTGELWKSYTSQVSEAALTTMGDYFADKADGPQTALKLVQKDKGKAADLFYGFTDLWAGHPNYIQYLIQNHPDAVKQIAAAAGYVPKGQGAPTVPPGTPPAAPPSSDYADEDQVRIQQMQAQIEAAQNDARITKEQLNAMVEQNAQAMYIQGEQRLDSDLDSYVAQKVNEVIPGAKPEVIRIVQASVKGLKTSDATMKDLHLKTLANRFGGNELSASNNFENLKRVADNYIAQVVPVFAGQVIQQNQQQHNALQAAARRVSPNGAALPPVAQQAANEARVDLRQSAVAKYDQMFGNKR